MKLNLAICDDSPADTKYLTDLAALWAAEKGHILTVMSFPSAESFLFRHDGDRSFDILLLDIEMGKMNGIDLAQNIRQTDSELKLVFITGYPEFIARGYDVSALHYLIKPATREKLFPVLDRAVAALSRPARFLPIRTEGGNFRLDLSGIAYAEAFSHSIHISASEGEFEVSKPLSELEAELGPGFVRCHRSYLVGLDHIARLSKTEVYLDSGKVIPLSRSCAATVHRAFVDHYRKGE